jgi:hypothetical protein
LVTLALFWGGGITPCLAYYPPLQDVTGPTVVQDNQTKVNVSVHNPATGQDIPGVWSTPGGAAAIAVDQLCNNQGMVAWRVKDLTNNKFQIVTGVYDPNPAMGWQFGTYWGAWLDYETNILALNDGVLLYASHYNSGSIITPSVLHVYYATYDPGKDISVGEPYYVGWRSRRQSLYAFSSINPYGYVVKDGVVAFFIFSPSLGYFVDYGIYNSLNHGWDIHHEQSVDSPTLPLQISNATVTWTLEGQAQKRGYDWADFSWHNGVDTKVLANFVFAPPKGNVNAPIYFTDMSIGATAWNWTLGDGATSKDRSLYHKYIKPGNYAGNQQANGPLGTDNNLQTVPVKPVTPSLWMLLLLDG